MRKKRASMSPEERAAYLKKHRDEGRAYRAKNSEHVRALERIANRKWRAKQTAEEKRDARFRQRYGIDLEAYDLLLEMQGGVCALCGQPPGKKERYLSVDHDHATGRVRALLCRGCNVGIGWIERAVWMASAQDYLEKYNPEREAACASNSSPI